jgi:hypothetical protein
MNTLKALKEVPVNTMPELLNDARAWVKENKWYDNSSIDEMSDRELLNGLNKHYEGGLIQFISDNNYIAKPLTIPQILEHNDFAAFMQVNNICQLFVLYKGGDKLEYYFFYNGDLLFNDNDYKPSILYPIDSMDSLIGLLGFLTVKPGDTDKEYFANYTPAQLAWCDSVDCEIIGTQVHDYDDKDGEYHTAAFNDFTQRYYQDIEEIKKILPFVDTVNSIGNVVPKMEISAFLFNLIEAGYTVTKDGHNYRAIRKNAKYYIISCWGEVKNWHIGIVTTYATRGKWEVLPKPIEQFNPKALSLTIRG